MTRNPRGRKPKPKRAAEEGPGHPVRDVRRTYRRSRVSEEWSYDVEDEEVEDLEDLNELGEIEESGLDVSEDLIESDEDDEL